jgi:hypothetical protein
VAVEQVNPYWPLRSKPSPATIRVLPNHAVILLWQMRSMAQNAATGGDVVAKPVVLPDLAA